MVSTWSKVWYADKGKQVNSMSFLPILSSWSDCPKTIPQHYTLEEPKQIEEWRTVETPTEIAKCLILRNKRHFGQAHGAMFTVNPLFHEIDWRANSITSELILEGTYKKSELSHTAKLLLEHYKKETNALTIAEKITKKEWKQRTKV
eukprot:9890891-Ditylum_brightwellii.AAC.1